MVGPEQSAESLAATDGTIPAALVSFGSIRGFFNPW
jgi:hypothetical protein